MEKEEKEKNNEPQISNPSAFHLCMRESIKEYLAMIGKRRRKNGKEVRIKTDEEEGASFSDRIGGEEHPFRGKDVK